MINNKTDLLSKRQGIQADEKLPDLRQFQVGDTFDASTLDEFLHFGSLGRTVISIDVKDGLGPIFFVC